MATAAAESDLERDLRDVGDKLSSPPSDSEALLSLLNLAENILWRVKQRPSNSICGALHLIMKALVTKDLMNHSEMDVKVALASCFSEIIRISAPADPYCENLMKAILRIIVDALTGIDDLSSCSHGKRVSILETITETHAFFMLLDLECDDLILEMFHRFLKTARQVNDGRVLAFMETMMTKLLSESEDILLSRLLDCVVKDIKDHLPIPSRSGEKVIGNCADKLRPYLIKLVRSNGDSCYYGDIIASICQENSDTPEPNKPCTSGECLIFQEETCHMQRTDDELDHILPETSSVPENKLLVTNTVINIFQEETCHMQGPDNELDNQLPVINSTPEDKLLETNMISQEETCHIHGPDDELDNQLPDTNSAPEDKLLETNMIFPEETCHMQGPDNELDHQLPVINSAPEDKLLETNMMFPEETCHMRPDNELDHQLPETNSVQEDKLLETNMMFPEETWHMQGPDNELEHQLPVINLAPEDKLLETNMEETCHIQGLDDELDHQLLDTNLAPEDKLLETNMEETCHMQGHDDELDHQLPDTNSAPEDKLLETNMITLVQKGSFLVQGSVDVPDHLLLETNSEPEHKLGETNMEYDNQLSEGTYFHELPQESGRLEQEVNCPNNSEAEKAFQETTRRSSRKIVKRKFFEEENCRTMKQKKNTKKIDLPTKKILKKCGETWTSKSTRKLNKIELSVLQKSIIEKLTGELIIIDDLVGEQSSKVLWRCYCPGL